MHSSADHYYGFIEGFERALAILLEQNKWPDGIPVNEFAHGMKACNDIWDENARALLGDAATHYHKFMGHIA